MIENAAEGVLESCFEQVAFGVATFVKKFACQASAVLRCFVLCYEFRPVRRETNCPAENTLPKTTRSANSVLLRICKAVHRKPSTCFWQNVLQTHTGPQNGLSANSK